MPELNIMEVRNDKVNIIFNKVNQLLLNNKYIPNVESKPRTKDVKIILQEMKIKWTVDKSEFRYYQNGVTFDESAINDTKASIFMNSIKQESMILKLKKKIRLNY